ncbi:MAG: ATP phosphoribosyltransferase regulatory subunit [Halieaceae bacterium]|jgi:ATP phosphoribosyltransferase regulatory subunit|nr:ATP phosphoribosyltransferase regulatory subunit [Halieaceae bacterium]
MTSVDRWLLPDGIEELLPGPAARVEALRRTLLDLHRRWGYQLVMPPLVEFTESLLIGLGSDIDMLTFRLTDQLSGRGMGIRADITPQVARIDAHSLADDGVGRYCYAGSVLHTRPVTLLGSRSPIKLGAELYGDASLQADIEVISLMLETLKAAGVEALTLDLGHVGICRTLLAGSGLDAAQQAAVYDALQRKSLPDLKPLLENVPGGATLLALASLHGGRDVLDRLPDDLDKTAVTQLREVAKAVAQRYPDVELYVDLAELRGYQYHTGLVFAAYVPGQGKALANGGRYDDVGEVFGRPRPATGFNTDLKILADFVAVEQAEDRRAIAAPAEGDAAMWAAVDALRAAGEIVIHSLSGERDVRCGRALVERDGQWTVEDQL